MPILATDIENLLLSRGYQAVHETQKKKAFLLGNHLPVYLNKTSKTGVSAMVIHPETQIKEWIEQQEDISTGSDYFHSSNLQLFPKRNNGGKHPIEYGWGLTFETLHALERCLYQLEGKTDSIEQDLNVPSLLPMEQTPLGCDVETTAMRREGHAAFRAQLERYWAVCAVTKVSHPMMLRASHIKPWSVSDPAEKTDPFNGLLLAAHLDVAFDRGLLTFNEQGVMIRSSQLTASDVQKLGLSGECNLYKIDPRHQTYLAYHRQNVFKN